jgi:hypothetical protein
MRLSAKGVTLSPDLSVHSVVCVRLNQLSDKLSKALIVLVLQRPLVRACTGCTFPSLCYFKAVKRVSSVLEPAVQLAQSV